MSSVPQHLKEHDKLGLDQKALTGANGSWPDVQNTKQFAAGIADVTSSGTYSHNPAFGWYAQAFVMPKESGNINSINLEAGDVGAVSNRVGWALYDGVTLAKLDSGVFTLTTSPVTFRSIFGLDVDFSSRSVVLALMGGTDGVGNSNLDLQVVDNPQQVLGLPTDHTASVQKVILPWAMTGSDYANAPPTAVLGTVSALISQIHRCTLGFT